MVWIKHGRARHATDPWHITKNPRIISCHFPLDLDVIQGVAILQLKCFEWLQGEVRKSSTPSFYDMDFQSI